MKLRSGKWPDRDADQISTLVDSLRAGDVDWVLTGEFMAIKTYDEGKPDTIIVGRVVREETF